MHVYLKANVIWGTVFQGFWQKEESFTETIRIDSPFPLLSQLNMLSNSNFQSAIAFCWQKTTVWSQRQWDREAGSYWHHWFAGWTLAWFTCEFLQFFETTRSLHCLSLRFLLLETSSVLLSPGCLHRTSLLQRPHPHVAHMTQRNPFSLRSQSDGLSPLSAITRVTPLVCDWFGKSHVTQFQSMTCDERIPGIIQGSSALVFRVNYSLFP